MTDQISATAQTRQIDQTLNSQFNDIIARYKLNEKAPEAPTPDTTREPENPEAKLSQECGGLLNTYQRTKEFLESGGRHVKNPYPDMDNRYVEFGCNFDKPKPKLR